jgi:glycosyltransferase involved in cell wall biosynthesis
VPVLASRIPGNVGLLGGGYPGYYPVEDDVALARLITRAASERGFYRRLKDHVAKSRAAVSPRREARELLAAISPQA